jgi:phosphoglycolate phosphatase-like HAD superfamily hydrolase
MLDVERCDACLLDLDGVLVDSRVALASAINAALIAHGLPPRPAEALHDCIGPRSRPVMVGDRSFDIEAGHAHGLLTIGALWGIGSEAELRAAGADLLARSPAHRRTLLLA